ncbi:MAG: alpha/beta hydrolase-fold protein [Saprospiraceae bacterium]
MAGSTSVMHQAVFTLELHTQHEESQPIYVVGNFNQWRVADEAFRMQPFGEGQYRLDIPLHSLPSILEYKYARGSWDYVELWEDGSDRPNRRVSKEALYVKDEVIRWKQDRFTYQSHLLPIIEIIDQQFNIPDPVRTRRIAALLPWNYYQTDRRYPVLYLQDGQNLFDDYAPYGNWAVDKRLAQLHEIGMGDVIIIAIDHAADKRIVEFTPTSATTRFGKGQGRQYARFLAHELKPWIDRQYRTLPDFNHTGVGGSSMGGLISIYAAMMYPQVYGKMMVFSPSLWVTPNIPFQLMNMQAPFKGRVYLYGGRKESDSMIPNLERLKKAMEDSAGEHKPVFRLSIDPQGEHNEARWGEEFPRALQWLYYANHPAS